MSGSNKKSVLVVFGTRPEAIKMAPVVMSLRKTEKVTVKICLTGQHREMLDSVMKLFGLSADFDLSAMERGQSLTALTGKILAGLDRVLTEAAPSLVMVHGDTTTTFAAAMASFYQKIPVCHVEAGLRTGEIYSPWPEEANRCLTSVLADLHFAPTKRASDNLLREGVPESKVHITGNTVIDALYWVRKEYLLNSDFSKEMHSKFPFVREKPYILVTGHRRESFDGGFERICEALSILANQNKQFNIIWPVHLNPVVKSITHSRLTNIENIRLIDPQPYLDFCFLMSESKIILTDSGGIQEEAPSLGKPVLVMRSTTERPEAVSAGTVKLVGTSTEEIITHVQSLITDADLYAKMSTAHNPYGDGLAASRISKIVVDKVTNIYE